MYPRTKGSLRLPELESLGWNDRLSTLYEPFAADGVVVSGGGVSDESSITGEPRPVVKRPGDPIRSGSRLHHGSVTICADKVGTESTLGQMIAVVQNTLNLRTPGEGRTEKILQWFVPAILSLAAATGAATSVTTGAAMGIAAVSNTGGL